MSNNSLFSSRRTQHSRIMIHEALLLKSPSADVGASPLVFGCRNL